MKRLNTILTINSLIVLIIIIERISPTGKILLQPFNFISIHELNQSVIFITAFIVISIFLLKEFSNNFRSLHEPNNTTLLILFITGAYLFGTGEGWHEISNFMFHQDCSGATSSALCNRLFINSFYTGNSIFFIGGVMMYIALIAFSAKHSVKDFSNKDMTILLFNSVITALTWFAYAAFDKVWLGLAFSIILSVTAMAYLWKFNYSFRKYPYITYSAVAYTLSALATIIVRYLL